MIGVLDGSALLHRRLGLGSYTYNLYEALSRIGTEWDWHIVYPYWRRPFHDPESFDGRCAVHRIRLPGSLWRWLFLDGRLSVGMAVPGADIYHSPDPVGAWLKGGLTVLTVHDTLTTHPKWKAQFPPPRPDVPAVAYALRSVGRADRIITVSQSTKTDLLDCTDIDPARLTVIPYGVEPYFRPLAATQAEPVLTRYGITPREYLLFVGRVEPRKNLKVVIETLRLLRDEYGLQPPLVVCNGGWDPGYQEAKTLLEAHDLAAQVQFVPYIEHHDMPALYSQAAAFVYPSLYEGFGLPPLEAMACGRPVVAADAASVPEVVGEAGLLAPPRDPGAFAAAIGRVLTNSTVQDTLRERGLERARRFSWEATARATIQVYRGEAVTDWDDRRSARGAHIESTNAVGA